MLISQLTFTLFPSRYIEITIAADSFFRNFSTLENRARRVNKFPLFSRLFYHAAYPQKDSYR